MRRRLALPVLLAGAMLLAGCSTSDSNVNNATGNTGSPNRNGVVETNANVPANLNGNTVSSNTAVLTNDNGNANTSGVRPTNTNANTNTNAHNTNNVNRNQNTNH